MPTAPTSFVLRSATASDAEALAELHVATWREAYTHLLPDGFFDEGFVRGRREMWARVLAAPRADRPVQIAERDGELIGFAMAGPPLGAEDAVHPRDRQLYTLYVSASVYGTGVGQALLDAVLGDGPAMLWVAKENPRAISFYRRNGFAFDGVEQIDPGAPLITDARMLR